MPHKPAATEPTTRQTIELYERHLRALTHAEITQVVRHALDLHLEENTQSYVSLWESNAGDLYLSDRYRQVAYEVFGKNDAYNQMAELHTYDDIETTGWYGACSDMEKQEGLKEVAEYDGLKLTLYPNQMGHAAREYCGMA